MSETVYLRDTLVNNKDLNSWDSMLSVVTFMNSGHRPYISEGSKLKEETSKGVWTMLIKYCHWTFT